MTDLRTAAQQALEALEALQGGCTDHDDGTVEAITVWCPEIIDALKAALAEPVQEPVVWLRVIDEAMIDHHIGVADVADDYETAKRKLNILLCCAQDIGAYFAKKAEEHAEPDSPARRCGGPGCDMKCCQPVQEPVAWIEHEWAGTGLRKLHFEKRDPTVRDEVVNPVWTPLYTAPPQRPAEPVQEPQEAGK